MPKIIIERERCKGCLLCISFCPKGLINVDDKLNRRGIKPVKFKDNFECPPSPRLRRTIRRSFSEGGCLGCSLCAIICPDCCITVYK